MCNSKHEKINTKNDDTFEKEGSQKFVLQVKYLSQYFITTISKTLYIYIFVDTVVKLN